MVNSALQTVEIPLKMCSFLIICVWNIFYTFHLLKLHIYTLKLRYSKYVIMISYIYIKCYNVLLEDDWLIHSKNTQT